MNSIKRIITIVMLYMLLLNILSVASAASFADLTNEDEVRTAEAVSGLNIMDGYAGSNLWHGDKKVTRAEMALYLCRLKGVGDLGSTSRETDFSDVESIHWASGYIQTAYELGITKGYNDGTYRPADNIKYEEAIMMLICAIGYEPYALAQGTYPTGHLYTANKLGLTKGVNGIIGQAVSRTMMTTLIYNSLDIPLMEQIIGSGIYAIFDGEEYAPKKTLLSENLGAVKITGIVTNNAISANALRYDQVQIYIDNNYGSRVVYLNSSYREGKIITVYVGDTDAKDLLGRKVEAYLTYETNDNNDPTVLAIFESTSESNKLTIEFDDIRSMEYNGVAYALKYWTDKHNNKSATIYVKDSATYYINSERTPYFTTSDLNACVDVGSFASSNSYVAIEFLLVGKPTDDYDYDYAFINVYENFVVDRVDKVGERIYAGVDSQSSLPYIDYMEDSDYYLEFVDENGTDINPVDLKENDVLTLQVIPYDYYDIRDIRSISGKLSNNSVGIASVVLSDDVKDVYLVEQEFDTSVGNITITLVNGKQTIIPISDPSVTITGFDSSAQNTNIPVVITYGEYKFDLPVSVFKPNLTYSSPSFTDETGTAIKNFGDHATVNANVKVKNSVACETPQTAYVYAAVYAANNTLKLIKQLDDSPVPASTEITLSATFTSKELANAQSIKVIALESGDTLNNLFSKATSISR